MSLPKPLVQLNQSFIVTSVLLAFLVHPSILIIPFVIGVYTLLTKQNPVISLGKRFLKKPLHQYTAEDKDQQLFNQWIATICLGLSLLFHYIGWTVLALVFSLMVLTAAGVALMGFCIGCTIRYRYLMWKHKRT
ncbi:DUF4395 domain-containing protein [Halobacillus naozhouensis]|uniref:DUF4395 domain-containing protein n=1 Tax=Halobacillus naozhouensis TaxID=554880 RepID=A0ABY8IZJ7_9BACI|nr:DUF4395 domain-containing protein [Halobacillus naozhouensis]WFT74802.1 DUF4395 domain-containing protein [Halobacillus naozhouensis]